MGGASGGGRAGPRAVGGASGGWAGPRAVGGAGRGGAALPLGRARVPRWLVGSLGSGGAASARTAMAFASAPHAVSGEPGGRSGPAAVGGAPCGAASAFEEGARGVAGAPRPGLGTAEGAPLSRVPFPKQKGRSELNSAKRAAWGVPCAHGAAQSLPSSVSFRHLSPISSLFVIEDFNEKLFLSGV